MQTNSKQKKYILIMLVTSLSLIFCCSLLSNSFLDFFVQQNTNEHDSCEKENVCLMNNQHIQIIAPTIKKSIIIFLLLIIIFALNLFLKQFKFDKIFLYIYQIKNYYGNFSIFNNLILLFKRGILNPKTF